METTKSAPEQDAAPAAPQRPASAPVTQAAEQSRSARMRSPRFRMFFILGAILLAVVGFFLWRYFSSYESTDDAQIDGHVNSISARVAGHVLKLNVQDNQFVRAGTVLVEIDPTDYQVAVDRAQADYNDAKATADAATVDVPIS
jgi:membrane fusion protein (multidrug efflux system)